MDPHTIIVLGPTPDSYFVGYGRRYHVANMPEGFTDHAKNKLNVSMTTWISMNNATKAWICYDVATDNYTYNGDIDPGLAEKIANAHIVTFPHRADPTFYCLKGKGYRQWNAVLPNEIIEHITSARDQIGDSFDDVFSGMLFGQGDNHILIFQAGFLAHVDDDVARQGEAHPLYKVLKQYDTGWTIERGSTLCSFDSQYFFLKFKQPGASEVKMHWNLPPIVAEKYNDLKEIANSPEERMILMQQDQMSMQMATARMNMQLQMSNALAQQMRLGGMAIAEAAGAGTIVRYY